MRHAEKTVMDLSSGYLKVGRPSGKVCGGSRKDLWDMFKHPGA